MPMRIARIVLDAVGLDQDIATVIILAPKKDPKLPMLDTSLRPRCQGVCPESRQSNA
jgi:hypothetical protein